MLFQKIESDRHEEVVFCNDPKTGLKAIIGIHSTALGPAVGGCRMWNYGSEEEALTDALRLSKGMTYKAAISGLDWGGGKSVIWGDPKTQKNPEMLERFGEFVDRFAGVYITAKDVGIGADDLRIIKTKTKHVLGIDGEKGSSGDPSPATAWGVYHGMKAAAKFAMGASSLKGMRISLQGLGSVAYYLLEHLVAEGAIVIGCDVDHAAMERAMKKYNIEIVNTDRIYDIPCDIFAPCALGASINPSTLPRLKTKIVAGAANNQLQSSEDGYELFRRGITYAPDYAINAGGLINIYHEAQPHGYARNRAFDHVAKIADTMIEILQRSNAERIPTHVVADQIAMERVNRGK